MNRHDLRILMFIVSAFVIGGVLGWLIHRPAHVSDTISVEVVQDTVRANQALQEAKILRAENDSLKLLKQSIIIKYETKIQYVDRASDVTVDSLYKSIFK